MNRLTLNSFALRSENLIDLEGALDYVRLMLGRWDLFPSLRVVSQEIVDACAADLNCDRSDIFWSLVAAPISPQHLETILFIRS